MDPDPKANSSKALLSCSTSSRGVTGPWRFRTWSDAFRKPRFDPSSMRFFRTLANGVLLAHEQLLLNIASALGRRASEHVELQELLRDAIFKGSVDSVVRSAVGLYLADPKTRAQRATELVAVDESFLLLPDVAAVANRQRQQLLGRLLSGRSLKGRFASKRDVRKVPMMSGSFSRWNPAQHGAYADLLKAIIAAKGAAEHERRGALRVGATIPAVGHQLVRDAIDGAGDNVMLLESALAASADTDRPDLALVELVGFAQTDRARVALYSAGRAARRCAPAIVGSVLVAAAFDETAKITSRKEAIRLLAQRRPTGASDALAWLVGGASTLHKDLRIALLWAAMQWPTAPWARAAIHGIADRSIDEKNALLGLIPASNAQTLRPIIVEQLVRLTDDSELSVRGRAFGSLNH